MLWKREGGSSGANKCLQSNVRWKDISFVFGYVIPLYNDYAIKNN